MEFECIDYKIRKKGKLIKISKKVHLWILKIIGNRLEMELSESFISKKIRIKIGEINIMERNNILESEKIEGIKFDYKNFDFKLKKKFDKTFDLFISGKKFIIGKIVKIENGKYQNNFEKGKFKKKIEKDKFKIKYKNNNNLKNSGVYFSVQGGRENILNELNLRKNSLEKLKDNSLKNNKVNREKVINFEFNINMRGSFFSNLKSTKNDEKNDGFNKNDFRKINFKNNNNQKKINQKKNNFENDNNERKIKGKFSHRMKNSYFENHQKNSNNIIFNNKNEKFIQIRNNININNSNFINFNETTKKSKEVDFISPSKFENKKKKFKHQMENNQKKRTKNENINEKKRFIEISNNLKQKNEKIIKRKFNKTFYSEISKNISTKINSVNVNGKNNFNSEIKMSKNFNEMNKNFNSEIRMKNDLNQKKDFLNTFNSEIRMSENFENNFNSEIKLKKPKKDFRNNLNSEIKLNQNLTERNNFLDNFSSEISLNRKLKDKNNFSYEKRPRNMNNLRKSNIFVKLKKKLNNVRIKLNKKDDNTENHNINKQKNNQNEKKNEEIKKKNQRNINRKKLKQKNEGKNMEINFSVESKKNNKNKYDFLNKDFIETFDCAKDITEEKNKQKTPFDDDEEFEFFKLDSKNDISTPFDNFDK